MTTKLTPAEQEAVKKVLDKFKVDYDPKQLEDQTFCIGKPFYKVHESLVKMLKAGRKTVTAAKLKDGTLTEVHDAAELAALAKENKSEKAVTTTIPQRGCPIPAYTPRELRANKVLCEFLTPEQLEDFEMVGAFVVRGSDTQERYRIAHRFSKVAHQLGCHLVTNLETKRGFCSHTTELPPSEETLALMLMIALRETAWINEQGGRFVVPRELHASSGALISPPWVCPECGWSGTSEETDNATVASQERLRVHRLQCPLCGNPDIVQEVS